MFHYFINDHCKRNFVLSGGVQDSFQGQAPKDSFSYGIYDNSTVYICD